MRMFIDKCWQSELFKEMSNFWSTDIIGVIHHDPMLHKFEHIFYPCVYACGDHTEQQDKV